ncbi:hypothetical protein AVEN_137522-1 [Araneus ventricosus]|uniref:Uncharacterized protein n=1 Tax=Araneus ventricosus TaxID=182803 RepID=A0A4Y2UFX3_ARAVE|nr:hypothetical protein AVEN_137522-1 [Araneus ventricosus]
MRKSRSALTSDMETRENTLASAAFKAGFTIQFMKDLDHNSSCFLQYIGQKMSGMSAETFKTGIYDGSQLINDHYFVDSINETERRPMSPCLIPLQYLYHQ